jgi:Bax protein
MLKKIFYAFITLLFLLIAYYFIEKKSNETKSEERIVKSVSQIKERQKLELAIKKIYEEAGMELSLKVRNIIDNAKDDMDFVLALKPSQVIAINKQVSQNRRVENQNSHKKLKYMALPNFRKYSAGRERKEIFFKYFFYLVESRNQQILKMRNKVLLWKRDLENITPRQKSTVQQLARKYKVKDFDIQKHSSWNRLLERLDIIPASLALAQGAKESLWGTSRFARYGYNYYGQRCFSRGCGIVPKARGNRRFEVTTFSSPRQGVNSYIHNLNTHFAYASLRKIRSRQRARGEKIRGLALAKALGKYSERGSAYINDLKSLIRYNKLTKYDIH